MRLTIKYKLGAGLEALCLKFDDMVVKIQIQFNSALLPVLPLYSFGGLIIVSLFNNFSGWHYGQIVNHD